MKRKAARMRRLLAVAGHLKQVREWRLKEMEDEQKRWEEKRHKLVEAFGRDDFRCAPLALMLRRNLDEAVRHERRARILGADRARDLQSSHRQMKQIERLSRAAGRAERLHDEKSALLDAIEQALRGK